jgi:hypothetical protein
MELLDYSEINYNYENKTYLDYLINLVNNNKTNKYFNKENKKEYENTMQTNYMIWMKHISDNFYNYLYFDDDNTQKIELQKKPITSRINVRELCEKICNMIDKYVDRNTNTHNYMKPCHKLFRNLYDKLKKETNNVSLLEMIINQLYDVKLESIKKKIYSDKYEKFCLLDTFYLCSVLPIEHFTLEKAINLIHDYWTYITLTNVKVNISNIDQTKLLILKTPILKKTLNDSKSDVKAHVLINYKCYEIEKRRITQFIPFDLLSKLDQEKDMIYIITKIMVNVLIFENVIIKLD